jgi:hypothetical protein
MASTLKSTGRRALKSLMREHKLNCRAVAGLLGRSHSTVLKWHAGLIPIPPDKLDHLRLKLASRTIGA